MNPDERGDRDRGRADSGYPAVQRWLPTSTAVLALVGGAGFGGGALFGEALQRVLYAHAETHLDPPAASIVVTSFLIAVLAGLGVLPSSVWVPTP